MTKITNDSALAQLPFTVWIPTLPPIPEPRNPSQAWMSIRRQEALNRVWERATRLFEPFVDDPGLSTTGYVMKLLTNDGTYTGWAKVGKPRKEGDYTEKFDGPYLVNLETGACSCPFYQSDGVCKHGLGATLWLHTFAFCITEKGYAKWHHKQPDQETQPEAEPSPLPVSVPSAASEPIVQESEPAVKKTRRAKKAA